MNNPAIMPGRPETVLQLGHSALKDREQFGQDQSDILAHFLQVQRLIVDSAWWRSPTRYSMTGGTITGSSFPEHEAFVYAAVYLRQLFAVKDHLFKDACDTYSRFVDSQIKSIWVTHEYRSFEAAWKKPGMHVRSHSQEDVFGAFLYGAYLVHSIPSAFEKPKKAFKEITANYKPEELLYELHMSLRLMMNHVSGVAAVIWQDYPRWVNDGMAPNPDVVWHTQLFRPKSSTDEAKG